MADFNNPWLIGVITSIFTGILLIILIKCWNYIKIRKIPIKKGLSLLVDKISVNIKVGLIQDIQIGDRNTALILPANTTFVDDCITDRKSALGAFFLTHFPDKITEAPNIIRGQLKNEDHLPNNEGEYPPGTSIILPSPYDSTSKVIITASTIRKKDVGIVANPSTICECIQQIFKVTSDKKISKLILPILGSGHGGVDKYDAIIFLLLAIKHVSRVHHHIKEIDIIVTPTDAEENKDIIYKVQYLALMKKEYSGGI